VGECFFWYRLTLVVPDKGRETVVVVIFVVFVYLCKCSLIANIQYIFCRPQILFLLTGNLFVPDVEHDM